MIPAILIIQFVCVILLGLSINNLRIATNINTQAISSLIDANKATMEHTRLVARFVGLRPKEQDIAKPS